MKRVFALTFFLFCNYVNAENTIIAIVNGDLVSLKSIENLIKFRGNSINLKAAEAFEVVKLVE